MYTPLHAAAASGKKNVVLLLLDLGAEVDAVNIYGNTALHVACLNGQDMVVSDLIKHGASINVVNNKEQVRNFVNFSDFLSYKIFNSRMAAS